MLVKPKLLIKRYMFIKIRQTDKAIGTFDFRQAHYDIIYIEVLMRTKLSFSEKSYC